MRLLLEAGADPNGAKTERGAIPLMRAVTEPDEAMVRMLLSHGADANAAYFHGWTSLFDAANYGLLYIMHLLLEAGADPNAVNSRNGETSLHILLRSRHSGRLDIVRLLLKAGADPNVAETQTGETPLM
ncbi:PREDICTED: putative ankyrin repeat protein RF_0381, partial [Priapulus caudatus]|uniref:Ankyrin repeat protein RF_0381 n=1 Tax=Priapulus caudatus TaxID=37621 RepID=A0ABM1ELG8_PRICU